MRILVFSERIAPPPDEGIKNFSLGLADALGGLGHEVLLLTTHGRDWGERGVINVPAGRLLHSSALKKKIRGFRPAATIYVPTASLTWASGMRSRTLNRYGQGSPVVLAALQGRRHNALTRRLARLAAPDLCLTLSGATRRQAEGLGWKAADVTPIVNNHIFRAVTPQEKAALRKAYGISAEAFVVLHVGHPLASRGIRDLASIADLCYPLLVCSRSDSRSTSEMDSLKASGVHVISGYIQDIQSLYQMADVYLFPVVPSQTAPGSIDFPLSVLEALSCNLPVVTTRFGALPEFWPDRPGIWFYDNVEQLRTALVLCRHWEGDSRSLSKGFGGERAAQMALDGLHSLGSRLHPSGRGVCSPAGKEPGKGPAAKMQDPDLAWASFLVSSWWRKDLVTPSEAPDLASVMELLRNDGFPLLSLASDSRPAVVKLIAGSLFQRELSKEREKLEHQVRQFNEIRERWQVAGISSLLLKALGPSPDFPYTSANLDVLVLPDRVLEARKCLRDLGYIELRHLEEPRKFLFRMYQSGKVSFDLHLHGRIEWHVSFLDDGAIWKYSQPSSAWPSVRIPSLEDGILITLAHAVFENKRLRLVDLAKILYAVQSSPLDWERMRQAAQSKGWLPGLSLGLKLCILLEKRLYGKSSLQDTLSAIGIEALTPRPIRKPAGLTARQISPSLRIPFLASKRLFVRKILRDQTQPPVSRAGDVVTHVLRGTRLRLGLQSQKSMLIALDGIDGSGKTTQARFLADAFGAAAIRHRTVWTRGGSSPLLQPAIRIGKKIGGFKKQPPTASPERREAERIARFRNPVFQKLWLWLVSFETALFYTTRIALPLLLGNVVIADRYLLGALLDLGVRLDRTEIFKTLPAAILRRVSPKPRFHFWLDVPWDEALARKGGQESSMILKEQAKLAPILATRLGVERLNGEEAPDRQGDRIVARVMRTYLDTHKTWLNSLFCSNPSPLPKEWLSSGRRK